MAAKFYELNKPVTYIPIPGTDAWDEDENNYQWYERGSTFTRHLATQNLVLHAVGYLPWSTSLDGFLGRHPHKHTIWKGAAKHMLCHLERVPFAERNIVAHSHGGQVVFYAMSYGLRIRNLITVGTPVRGDMEKTLLSGLGNVDYWHHICDSKTDKTSILGALFDGKLRVKHTFDLCSSQDDIKGIGHSKILNEQQSIELWNYDQKGWAPILAMGKAAFVRP